MAWFMIVEDDELPWVMYAAGLVQGAGNANAAAAIGRVVARLAPIAAGDIPADEARDQDEILVEVPPAEPLLVDGNPNLVGGPPPPPMHHQSDFGAGPPGRGVR